MSAISLKVGSFSDNSYLLKLKPSYQNLHFYLLRKHRYHKLPLKDELDQDEYISHLGHSFRKVGILPQSSSMLCRNLLEKLRVLVQVIVGDSLEPSRI